MYNIAFVGINNNIYTYIYSKKSVQLRRAKEKSVQDRVVMNRVTESVKKKKETGGIKKS